MDDVRLYLRLVGGRARSQLQYPAGFALDVVGATFTAALDLVALLVLFSNIDVMDGWSVAQVCVLFGVAQTAFALAELLVGHLDKLPVELRAGSFDMVLLQPRSSLLLMVASDFSMRRLGQLALALVTMAIAWQRAGLSLEPSDAVLLVLTVVTGTVIFGAVWVIGAASTFWTIDTMELTNSFTYGGRQLTSYPLGIYHAWLRRFVVFVVPLGCVAYFPVRHVVGLDPPGTSPFTRVAGVPAAVGLVLVASIVWRAAVRTYRGTGS
ncbi:MAG: ABC-2 family transporter protein [Acidimicrobiales bacterium]